MFALLGFLGLTVDVGYLQFQKRRIQSAADAAAAGAAFQLAAQASHDTAKVEGLYDSKKNGFEDAVNGVTITINIPRERWIDHQLKLRYRGRFEQLQRP